MTLNEALPNYLRYIKTMRSKGTYDFYKQHAKFPIEELGDMNVEDINDDTLIDYIDKQKSRNKNIKNSTLNKHMAFIKSIYKYATKKDLAFPKLKETKLLIKVIPDDVKKKIFDHYESRLDDRYAYRNYLMLRMFADTGIRMNELINIRLENIDMKNKCIIIDVTKTSEDRILPFTPETARYLQKFLMIHHRDNDYLFYDFDTDNKMTTSSIESVISRLKAKLDLDVSITPHKWRHGFATEFNRKSGNIEILRLILGHSNLKTTQKYLHVTKEDILDSYRQTFVS